MKAVFNRFVLMAFLSLCFCTTVFAVTMKYQDLTVLGHSVRLQIPEGTEVEFLGTMDGPRFLDLGPDNELLIGSNNSKIYRCPSPYTTPDLLVNLPGRNHSVAYRNGRLYVAETAALHQASYNGLSTDLNSGSFSVYVKLPSATGGHWSRTVMIGPDHALYVALGISGNCSDEYLGNHYDFERRRGGVYKLDESGAIPKLVPFSSGLRNPIGLAFDLSTNELWVTNAGSDDLGFDFPREIFSRLTQGSFHGMPWFQFIHGSFQAQDCIKIEPPRPATEAVSPSITFDARSTPEGIAFMPDSTLGLGFSGNAIVAIHGSWAKPPGGGDESRRSPKLVMVVFSNNEPQRVEDIVTGFQRNDGSRFARPSGVLVGRDGYLYFTSDRGDVEGLFRLKPSTPSTTAPSMTSWLPLLFDRE